MERELKKLYLRFLKFFKKDYFLNVRKFSTSLKNLNIPRNVLEKFFSNYEKPPFLLFLKNLKDIVFSKTPFDFILKNYEEDWSLWRHIKFLEKESLIEIKKDGKIKILKKKLFSLIPRPKEEWEIKEILEKKMKRKINPKDFSPNFFFGNFFKVKKEFDQMPISQSSAIFLVKKILDYLPLKKFFLFVGDDDFISLYLTLVDPEIQVSVYDIDDEILGLIRKIKKKFKLKIETKKVDIEKEKNLEKKFIGFLVNPVYTEDGVKEFLIFGKKNLSLQGGFCFLVFGDEGIGNRILFLEKFFAKENLVTLEKINQKIYYPHILLYEEDKEIKRRLKEFFPEKLIEKSPKLGATLYVFFSFPFKPKRIKFKRPMYAYL